MLRKRFFLGSLMFGVFWLFNLSYAANPEIQITHIPIWGGGPSTSGTIKGTVTIDNPTNYRVVIYAETDKFYVQPLANNYLTAITSTGPSTGTWTNWTHLGWYYYALLVPRTFVAPAIADDLPGGPDVLASTPAAIPVRSVQPTSGAPGTLVTITGGDFGNAQGESTVTFNGVDAGQAISWTANEIKVAVPTNATDGKVVVTVNGQSREGTFFDVQGVGIITLTHIPVWGEGPFTSGTIKGTVTIENPANYRVVIYAQTDKFFVQPLTDNYLTAITSTGPSTGTWTNWTHLGWYYYAMLVRPTFVAPATANTLPTNSPDVLAWTPAIPVRPVQPTSGAPGTVVTITGGNFGNEQGAATVTFNGVDAGQVIRWTDNEIKVAVPANATDGVVVVTVNGQKREGSFFDVIGGGVIALTLLSAEGVKGTSVTVNGSGFAAGETIRIDFGSRQNLAPGVVVQNDGTFSAVVSVPDQPFGSRTVTVTGLTSTRTAQATFSMKPSVSSPSPNNGTVTTSVSISGAGFGASETITITFGSTSPITTTTTNSDGAFSTSFTVNPQPYGPKQMKVKGTSTNQEIVLENAFTIQPRITSITPNRQEAGKNVAIAGDGYTTGAVNILLVNKDTGALVKNLALGVDANENGAISFSDVAIPGDVVPGAYHIRVEDTSNATIAATSDFTVDAIAVLNITAPTPNQVLPAGTTSTTLTVRIENHTGSWHWQLNAPFPANGAAGGERVESGNTATISGLSNGQTYTVYVTLVDAAHNVFSPPVTASVSFSVAPVTLLNISVSPESVNFGSVTVGQSSDQTITITNPSSSTGTLSGSVGSLSSPFAVVSGDGSLSLSPGQSKSVVVRFSPTAAGAFSGTLSITHSATNRSSPLNVSFSANGAGITQIQPAMGSVGTEITVEGAGFPATMAFTIDFGTTVGVATGTTDAAGSFSSKFRIKEIQPNGNVTIKVTVSSVVVLDQTTFSYDDTALIASVTEDTNGATKRAGERITIRVTQRDDFDIAKSGTFRIGEKIQGDLSNDGQHNDGSANDTVWGAQYPVQGGDMVANQPVIVTLKDNIGNVSTAQTETLVNIDALVEIVTVKAEPTTPMKAGGVITVTAVGDANAQKVSFSIPGIAGATEVTMAERITTPGTYTGTYTVKASDNTPGVKVLVTMTAPVGNTARKESQEIVILDTIVDIGKPETSRTVIKNGETLTLTVTGEIDLKVWVTGISALDSTQEDRVDLVPRAAGVYSALIPINENNTAANGPKTLTIKATDAAGNEAQAVTVSVELRNFAEFEVSVPKDISLIHIPLKVTAVITQTRTLKTVSDLYDALGGADNVSFIITRDTSAGVWRSYLSHQQSKGTAADKAITDDLGLITVMKNPVTLRLKGDALGTDGKSQITLKKGTNLVGVPLRNANLKRVSDLLSLEGIKGNATSIVVSDAGTFRVVARPGDPGDIALTGGQSFIVTARTDGVAPITGEAWDHISGTPSAAPPMTVIGLTVETQTPVLDVHGAVVSEVTGAAKDGFRVIVKNLSTGASLNTRSGGDMPEGRYSITFVESSRPAAQVGDVLEITVETQNPLIGVQPLRHTVTTDEVLASQIQIADQIAYEIPKETKLKPNYPNPFNPETWVPYRLAKDSFVTLTIYDTTGKLVRTLQVGHQPAAVYESKEKAIYWDGRNGFGERVASGIYFYTLTANDFTATRKMLILK